MKSAATCATSMAVWDEDTCLTVPRIRRKSRQEKSTSIDDVKVDRIRANTDTDVAWMRSSLRSWHEVDGTALLVPYLRIRGGVDETLTEKKQSASRKRKKMPKLTNASVGSTEVDKTGHPNGTQSRGCTLLKHAQAASSKEPSSKRTMLPLERASQCVGTGQPGTTRLEEHSRDLGLQPRKSVRKDPASSILTSCLLINNFVCRPRSLVVSTHRRSAPSGKAYTVKYRPRKSVRKDPASASSTLTSCLLINNFVCRPRSLVVSTHRRSAPSGKAYTVKHRPRKSVRKDPSRIFPSLRSSATNHASMIVIISDPSIDCSQLPSTAPNYTDCPAPCGPRRPFSTIEVILLHQSTINPPEPPIANSVDPSLRLDPHRPYRFHDPHRPFRLHASTTATATTPRPPTMP
uniref:Uncharacterized protein n=1 Tax=Panagrellus redivivus TaxID=6233 RepID=A0A7E4W008_PANRE